MLETGYIDFDFEKNVMIMNFDEPIKRSFEVTVLAITSDYELDIDCRAGKRMYFTKYRWEVWEVGGPVILLSSFQFILMLSPRSRIHLRKCSTKYTKSLTPEIFLVNYCNVLHMKTVNIDKF